MGLRRPLSQSNTHDALREFADRSDVEFAQKSTLQQAGFWFGLQELLDLFNPLHEAQKKSEDNKANIGYVYQRWNEIEAHLQSYSTRDTQFAADVKQYLNIKPSPDVKLTGIDKKN